MLKMAEFLSMKEKKIWWWKFKSFLHFHPLLFTSSPFFLPWSSVIFNLSVSPMNMMSKWNGTMEYGVERIRNDDWWVMALWVCMYRIGRVEIFFVQSPRWLKVVSLQIRFQILVIFWWYYLLFMLILYYYTFFVLLYLLHFTFYAFQCVILFIYILNYINLKIIKKLISWKYAIRRFRQYSTWLYFYLHTNRNI